MYKAHVLVLSLGAVAGLLGCSSTIDQSSGSASTGGAGAGSSASSGGSGGGGAGASCLAPADCPGTDDACQTRTCAGGVCGKDFTPSGTVLSMQKAGDCRKEVCDGKG